MKESKNQLRKWLAGLPAEAQRREQEIARINKDRIVKHLSDGFHQRNEEEEAA